MKQLLFLGILFFIGLVCKAQRVYFIYLQSENAIPFYVKMGDKIHSSSTAGYLILSNLKDSVYSLSVGLPGKQQAEPKFKVTIANGDRGFLIKELDQKLSLFDFHSLEILAPIAVTELKDESYVTRTDNFTKTLSQAANDPTLMQETIKREPVKDVVKEKPAVTEEKSAFSKDSVLSTNALTVAENEKKDTVSVVTSPIKTDTLTVAAQTSTQNLDTAKAEEVKEIPTVREEVKDSVKTIVEPVKVVPVKTDQEAMTAPEYKRSTVVRRSESSTSEGFGLTYIDYTAEGSDTIRLLIPNPKTPYKSVTTPKAESTTALIALEDQSSAPTVIDTTKTDLTKKVCVNNASDSDFRRLRKEMAAQESDAEMIAKAKYVFQSKCFSTEQLKNLSTLFLTAEGKYLFFETSLLHITDSENVGILQTELKDEHYSNKFKALISK